MSRIFYKGTHDFINPKRTRVRFYSKMFKKYYTVWISKYGFLTTKKGAAIMMIEGLSKIKFIAPDPNIPLIEDYIWETLI